MYVYTCIYMYMHAHKRGYTCICMYIHVYACIYANAYFLGDWPRLIFSASSPNCFFGIRPHITSNRKSPRPKPKKQWCQFARKTSRGRRQKNMKSQHYAFHSYSAQGRPSRAGKAKAKKTTGHKYILLSLKLYSLPRADARKRTGTNCFYGFGPGRPQFI